MWSFVNRRQKLVLGVALAVMLLLILDKYTTLIVLPPGAALVLSVATYLVLAWKVPLEAFKTLIKTRRFTEQTLMVIATFGAFGLKDYPEALAVMVFYIIGDLFEEYAAGRSRNEITALIKLKPSMVRVLDPDGAERQEKPKKVRIGEIIRVAAGEAVALDGYLLEENAALDTSALTGESTPRPYHRGEEVPSGCINCSQVITLKVSRDSPNSSLTRLLNLIEDAAANKSRPETLIRRFALWYTPIVVGAAAFMALLPLFWGGENWSEWIMRALVFLVVSCPCALVLSVPLTFFGGLGAISKTGVMIKGTIYLENLSRIKLLAFDKTGTLTSGEFSVEHVRAVGADEKEMVRLCAALESCSTHPLARAVVERARELKVQLPKPEQVVEKAGLGISGVVEGRQVTCGRLEYIRSLTSDLPKQDRNEGTDIHVVCDGRWLGTLELFDRPRESAAASISSLHELGIKTYLLTGDRESSAKAAATRLHISDYRAEQLPEDKLRNFKELKEKYGCAAFAGDGINDAPVLAASDVGIAMGQFGSAAAVEAADVVVMSSDLGKIPGAVKLSRRTCALAMQNMIFVIAVKLTILVLGALGLAGIWLAIFGDVGVLILAVLNAMRTLRFVK